MEVEDRRRPHQSIVARTASYRMTVYSYCNFVELLACLAFGFVGYFLPGAVMHNPNRNGVPFQQVQGGGDGDAPTVLFDLTFDREFGEETVPTALVWLLTALVSLVVQSTLSVWLEAREAKIDEQRRQKEAEGVHTEAEAVEGRRITPQPPSSRGDRNVKDEENGDNGGILHRTLCTYFVTGGMTHLATHCVKRYVGYMRPVFYSSCNPDADALNNGATALECRSYEDGKTEHWPYQSFPSGHASVSFAGMTLLALYFSRIFGRRRGDGDGRRSGNPILFTRRPKFRRFLRLVFVMLPMALAIFIAASRVADNYHHPADVVGGAVLGASCALFANDLWL